MPVIVVDDKITVIVGFQESMKISGFLLDLRSFPSRKERHVLDDELNKNSQCENERWMLKGASVQAYLGLFFPLIGSGILLDSGVAVGEQRDQGIQRHHEY